MNMNLFRRGMIFVTFLGSCLGIALVVAALGTKFWIVARARRVSNPEESDGRIHFGLFDGKKELNVAYGWRTYDVSVLELMRTDHEFLLYGLWVAAIACIAGALLFAGLSAIFAVINTATTPIGTVTGVPGLYLWNSLAISLWAVQFYQKLQHNVMSREDRDNMWSSANMAHYGYSFWLVVGAVVVHVINITAIYIGTHEAREKTTPQPVMEEKSNGAIMLY
ncbi:clarin-2 isoform X2 [Zootermopsis nevadensis]|uniref:clarin-2 isoform X2 n=1 Tax=Zootermopsis nevadensis TaxID=136037 RepID=UPI000B8EB27B|nr:clarin-2 isoform X2 [Zootermopsis nevadensis]